VLEDVYEKIDKELLEFVEDVLLNRWGSSAAILHCVIDVLYGSFWREAYFVT
jgi:hypothetical protein